MEDNSAIIKSVILNQFPTLHHHVSLDKLLEHYGSYEEVLKNLNMLNYYSRVIGEMPMGGAMWDSDMDMYYDTNYEPIDPFLPENVKYIASYHRPIRNCHKKLTFLFFRHLDKIPTSLFTLKSDEIITAYTFIQMDKTPGLSDQIYDNMKDRITNPANTEKLEQWINHPLWNDPSISKYYPMRSLEEEIYKMENNTSCEYYPATGFEVNIKTITYQKIFEVGHPVVEICFNT